VILADLDALGYAVAWTVLGACKVGACHHRHRLFLAATTAAMVAPDRLPLAERSGTTWERYEPALFGDPAPLEAWPQAGVMAGRTAWAMPADPCGSTGILLPTPTARVGGDRGTPSSQTAARRMAEGRRNLEDAVALLPTVRASDAEKGGPNQRGSSGDVALPAAVQPDRFGVYGPAVGRQESALGHLAPDPTEPGRLGRPRLAAGFAEWMMGCQRGYLTDHVTRRAAIRIAGNGVVHQAATVAYAVLLARLGITDRIRVTA